jgi:hypothetical protein
VRAQDWSDALDRGMVQVRGLLKPLVSSSPASSSSESFVVRAWLSFDDSGPDEASLEDDIRRSVSTNSAVTLSASALSSPVFEAAVIFFGLLSYRSYIA